MLPPTLNSVAWPLNEGDCTSCVIEKEIPLQGEGEQSTKSGGPWPNWLQPLLLCKFENELSPLPVLGAGDAGGGAGDAGAGAGDDGAGEAEGGAGDVGAGVLAVVAFATVIWRDLSCETPLESEAETLKLKFPLAPGVPEMIPVLSASCMPCGNCPDTTAKV